MLTSTGRYLGTIGNGQDFRAVEVLDDGTIVGLTATDLRFFDAGTGAETALIPVPGGQFEDRRVGVRSMDSDGSLVAVGTAAGSVLVVENGKPSELRVSDQAIRSVAVSGASLAVGTVDGFVHLVDLRTGQTRWSTQVMLQRTFLEVVGQGVWDALPQQLQGLYKGVEGSTLQSGASTLVIEPSGRVVANGLVHLVALDGASGAITRRTVMPSSPTTGVPWLQHLLASLPNGRLVTAGSFSAAIFDPALNVIEQRAVQTGRSDANVTATALTVRADGTPIWGLSNGQVVTGLGDSPLGDSDRAATGLAAATGVALAADGRLLVAGDGGIVQWGLDGSSLVARAVPAGPNNGATVSEDGKLVVAAALDSGADSSLIYDLGSDEPRLVPFDYLPGHSYSVSLDPLGRYIDAGKVDQPLSIFDRATMRPVGSIFDSTWVAFSFDGSWLVSARLSGPVVEVFDATTFKSTSVKLDLSASGAGVLGMVPGFISSGSELFVSAQDSATTVVFDTSTWQQTRVIGPDDHGGVIAARFSRDGSTLVTLGNDGTISLRDPTTWAFVRSIAGGVSSRDNLDLGLYLSENGEYLVTTRDGKPRLWHLPTSTMIGAFPHTSGRTASGNDLGHQVQLVTLADEKVYVWNLDVTSWPHIACRAAGRNLTRDEWDQFGPKNVPYQQTCPDWPAAS